MYSVAQVQKGKMIIIMLALVTKMSVCLFFYGDGLHIMTILSTFSPYSTIG